MNEKKNNNFGAKKTCKIKKKYTKFKHKIALNAQKIIN